MLLAQILNERKWVSKPHIEECLREQGAGEPGATIGRKSARPLGVVMLSRGLITDRQLVEILEEVRKRRGTDPPSRGAARKLIGEILVDLGVIHPDQLKAALAEQARATTRRRLGEILVERGWVTPAHVIDALRHQDKMVMSCAACGAHFNVVGFRPWVEYACKRCGKPLEMDTKSVGVTDSSASVPTLRDEDTPAEVREASRDPQAHFGNFIIIGELLRGNFGPLYKCWRKDSRDFVGLIFLNPSLDAVGVAKTFGQVREATLTTERPVSRVLEVGEHGGRKYMAFVL